MQSHYTVRIQFLHSFNLLHDVLEAIFHFHFPSLGVFDHLFITTQDHFIEYFHSKILMCLVDVH
jgi:hypothetical protein